jgi:uncharacterized OB-fold protein
VIEALGTYLPAWGAADARHPGVDEDAVTMAVAAGRQALASDTRVERVVLVTRQPPLLEGGNGAALLAGLGLPADTEVVERLGAAPATLEAVASAAPGTLVVGADAVTGRAGAAAALCSTVGARFSALTRVNRSLPTTVRDASGRVAEYADPRLLRDLGVAESVERARHAAASFGPVRAVAGLPARDAASLCEGSPPPLPTTGASAPLFALAALAGQGETGQVLAVEQATVALGELGEGAVVVARDERAAQLPPIGTPTPGPEIAISLAAYERAFDAKLRLDAARCTTCGLLSYPPRLRCLGCGSEAPTHTAPLPRDAAVYSCTTVHVAVPGLTTPYSVVLAELGDSGVRVLVHVTGAKAGSVAIGDQGQLAFRRVAVRSGIPDYGYAFLPDPIGDAPAPEQLEHAS